MTTIKGALKLQPSRANILLKKKFKFYFEIVQYNFSINRLVIFIKLIDYNTNYYSMLENVQKQFFRI